MLVGRWMLLLPEKGPGFSPVWFLLVAMVGVLFWLAGTKFSRATLVLVAVTIGAILSKKIAVALGYHPDPMAAAIGGAVLAALLMVFLHRFVIAVALASLLAICSAAAVWAHATLPAVWSWPIPKAGGPSWASLCAAQLPSDLAQQLAAISAITFLGGLLLAAMMPRLARSLFWSLLGVVVITASCLTYGAYGNSHVLTMLPAQTHHQVLALAVAVLIGITVQTWPRRPASIRETQAQSAPALA